MFRAFKNCHSSDLEVEAMNALEDPSRFNGLYEITSDPLLQIFLAPSFSPYCSWSIYRESSEHYRVRRIRWDFRSDMPVRIAGATLYGSDQLIEKKCLDKFIERLSLISFPAFFMPSQFGIDGTTYGVRRAEHLFSIAYSWWNRLPSSHDDLVCWYSEVQEYLEECMSGSTTLDKSESCRS